MSLEDLYDHNELDQDQWHVRAVRVESRMKTRSKQPIGVHSAVGSTCGTRD